MWNTHGVRTWSEAMSWLAHRDPYENLDIQEREVAERVEEHLRANFRGDKGEVVLSDELFPGLTAKIAEAVSKRITAYSDFNCSLAAVS